MHKRPYGWLVATTVILGMVGCGKSDKVTAPPPNPAGEWVQIQAVGQEIPTTLLVTSTGAYAGTSGLGVFRSTDNGDTWVSASNGLTNGDVLSLAVKGPHLFAGTRGGGLLRSNNNAQSWATASNGLTNSEVQALAVSGTGLFAGTLGGGVFRSTNDGATWTAVNTGLPATPIVSALASSAGGLYVAIRDHGVFRSIDDGGSWTPVNGGLRDSTSVVTLAVNGASVFAGSTESGGAGVVWRSSDGTTWTAAHVGSTVHALAASGTSVYAGTDEGVFRSVNDGDTWDPISGGLPFGNSGPPRYFVPAYSVHSLAVSGTRLFAGLEFGVFHSNDNGATWTGPPTTYVQSLAALDGDLFIGYLSAASRSSDDGTVWVTINKGLTNTTLPQGAAPILTFASTGTSILAAGHGIWRSSNRGTDWTSVSEQHIFVRTLAARGAMVWAGTAGSVLRSTNEGTSWQEVYDGLPSAPDVSAFADNGTSLFVGIANGLFGSTDGGVYRSDDLGDHWTAAHDGLTNTSVRALTFNGTTLFAGTDGGGVFRSTDGGASWTAANAGLPASSFVSAFARNGTVLYAGFSGSGVYRTTDGGATWSPINAGLTDLDVKAMAVSGTKLVIGTPSGVFLLQL